MNRKSTAERHGATFRYPGDASLFGAMRVARRKDPAIRTEYSITEDVLAFRRCPRQYGHFAIHGFVPAQTTQLYFGVVIHEVLDRIHRQFQGRVEGRPSGLPTDQDVESYFVAVTEALRARGIRPYSRKAEESAKTYLKRFNTTWGPTLYPLVIDTEHKLKADMRDYVLTGVVDVLARPSADGGTLREIWDYKGSHRVEDSDPLMENYLFQMRVYAELFRRKNGAFPARAVLCFVAEDDPARVFVEVPFDTASVAKAMDVFSSTVGEIEQRKEAGDWSPPASPPSRETCAACDSRWDCTTVAGSFRRPAL